MIRRGQRSEGIYIVHSGEIDLLYSEKPRIPLITLDQGGILGENFILGEPEIMTSSVRSKECILIYVPLAYLLDRMKSQLESKQILSRLRNFSIAKLVVHKTELKNFITVVNSILSSIQRKHVDYQSWKGCSRKALKEVLNDVRLDILEYLSYDNEFDPRMQELVTEAVNFSLIRYSHSDGTVVDLYDKRLPVVDHEVIASEHNSILEINHTKQFKQVKSLETRVPEISDKSIQTQRQRRIISLVNRSDAPTRKEALTEIEQTPQKEQKEAKIAFKEQLAEIRNNLLSKQQQDRKKYSNTNESPSLAVPKQDDHPYKSQAGVVSNPILDQLDSIEYRGMLKPGSARIVRGKLQQNDQPRSWSSDKCVKSHKNSTENVQRSHSVMQRLTPVKQTGHLLGKWDAGAATPSTHGKVTMPCPKVLSTKPKTKDSDTEGGYLPTEPRASLPRIVSGLTKNPFMKPNDPKQKTNGQRFGEKNDVAVVGDGQVNTTDAKGNGLKRRIPKTESFRKSTKILCTVIKSGLVGEIKHTVESLSHLLDPTVVNLGFWESLDPKSLFASVAAETLSVHCLRTTRSNNGIACLISKKRKANNEYLAILEEREDKNTVNALLGNQDNLLAAQEYQNLDLDGMDDGLDFDGEESICSEWFEDFPYGSREEMDDQVTDTTHPLLDLSSLQFQSEMQQVHFNTLAKFNLTKMNYKLRMSTFCKNLSQIEMSLDRIHTMYQ